MVKNLKYIIIIPTHRIEFLKKNLESIMNQNVKPDLIIGIDDTDDIDTDSGITKIKELFIKVSQTIPIMYYNKNDKILEKTILKTGPMRAFANIFLCLEDTISNFKLPEFETSNEYLVHILEDDCYYLRKTTIEKIINQHKKFNTSLYKLNLVENQDDIQKALNETLKNPNKVRTDINYNVELIDTSSFIFKYDKKIIDQIIKYLENKQYTLSADVYVFEILFNYFSKRFTDLNSILIFSTQHPLQVSRKFDNDLKDDSHNWLYDLKLFGININERNLYNEFVNSLVEIKERRENNPITKEEYFNIPSIKFAIENSIKLGIFGV